VKVWIFKGEILDVEQEPTESKPKKTATS
jgi:ribosomal protein S3